MNIKVEIRHVCHAVTLHEENDNYEDHSLYYLPSSLKSHFSDY